MKKLAFSLLIVGLIALGAFAWQQHQALVQAERAWSALTVEYAAQSDKLDKVIEVRVEAQIDAQSAKREAAIEKEYADKLNAALKRAMTRRTRFLLVKTNS